MSIHELISAVREFSKKNSEKDDIHGFPHVERVYEICEHIGGKLEANMLVLKIAALLHDIGRIKEKQDPKGRNHAEISAEIALTFLKNFKHNLSHKEIENIMNAIRAHSFSNKIPAKTLEAQILSDSDKLDALGAIGLYRTIGFTIQNGGGLNQVIHHLENKILKLKNQMYLNPSKKIADRKERLILDFYNKVKEEI